MARNIYVIGAQGTGKTTLVNALANHFKQKKDRVWQGEMLEEPRIIKEVARNVLQKHGFTASDITTSKERALQLQELILQAQFEAEQATEGSWFISDRSGLDPVVYAKVYVGESAASEMLGSATWRSLRLRDGLVIVCEAGSDWLWDDGVRLMPTDTEEWMALHKTFCALLRDLGIDFEIVSRKTSVAERVQSVSRWWRERVKCGQAEEGHGDAIDVDETDIDSDV